MPVWYRKAVKTKENDREEVGKEREGMKV